MIPLSWYGMGVAGVLAIGAVGYAMLENSWRQNAELVAAQEKEANIQNQRTIRLLKESNKIYEEIAAELRTKVEEIRKKEEDEDAAIDELSGSDEEIRKYLTTPIPLRLRCLLNHEKCPERSGVPDASKATSMP